MLTIELHNDWQFYCCIGTLALYHSPSLTDCIAWCGHKKLKYQIKGV